MSELLLETRYTGIKYITKHGDRKIYLEALNQEVERQYWGAGQEQNTQDLDIKLSTQIKNSQDMEDIINKFSAAQTAASSRPSKSVHN